MKREKATEGRVAVVKNTVLGLDLDTRVKAGEVERLYVLSKAVGEGAIVEIGSWKGHSTLYLARGVKNSTKRNKVYAVDPHLEGTEAIFRDNMKRGGVDDVVVPIVMRSEDAAKQWHRPVSLLFIDGLHDYDNVKKDFVLWEPWVVKGGVIAFHDRLAEGPCRVIREYVLRSKRFGKTGVVEGIFFAVKGIDLTFSDNLVKFRLLLASYLVSLFHWLTRPKPLRPLRNKIVRLRRRLLGQSQLR